MKKKLTRILLVCLLLAAAAVLTACGETPESAPETAPAAAEQAAPEAASAPETQTPAESEEPAEPEAEEAPVQAEPEAAEEPGALETALSFVDQDAQLLLDALGEPQQKLYEASCSGPGDDGIWIYDGLTVFTYLENGVETVVDAE